MGASLGLQSHCHTNQGILFEAEEAGKKQIQLKKLRKSPKATQQVINIGHHDRQIVEESSTVLALDSLFNLCLVTASPGSGIMPCRPYYR